MYPCGKVFTGIDIEIYFSSSINIVRQPTATLTELFNDLHRTSLSRWLL
jgi:hypothetical protein